AESTMKVHLKQKEEALTGAEVQLEILLDAQTLQNMKLAAGQLGIPDAANKLYEVMNKLVKK
ncbi:hypothetical protein ACT453_36015, partial [Bacillus sp. D-CC]